MDKKQTLILDKILDKNDLPDPIKFKQYRNLNEFKYFVIEKINPNHRIFLYGILKNNNKKKDTSKSFIKAGEIIIVITSFFGNVSLFYDNIDLISLVFSMFCLNCFMFYFFGNFNILKILKEVKNGKINTIQKSNIEIYSDNIT
jgi:hypothetical protein